MIVPVFASGYDAVIRLSFGATSRRSILIVCAFIHGQARGLLRRRINQKLMEDLSLHILDIVENATAAGAKLVEIIISQDTGRDRLQIVIRDNGRGMDPDVVAKARDPFFTTRTTRRVGLGLALLHQATREAGGDFSITSEPGQGTEVRGTFQASHIDRKPIGDMGSTLVTLILGNPDVDFIYETDFDGEKKRVDTRLIKAELNGTTTISDPAVLKLIRDTLKNTRDNVNATHGGKKNG